LAIGIPLVATATETLKVCYQSNCQEVDVTDATQRDVGLGLTIPGAMLLLGGAVLVGVGSHKVPGEPAANARPAPQSQRASYVPELVLLPSAGSARWRF